MNLTTLATLAKDHPLPTLASMGAALVLAAFAIDERYAHAGDVRNLQANTVREIQINRISGEISLMELRINDSRNRARELTAKQKLTQGEMALAQQYNTDVSSLEAEKRQKQRLLDQIKAGVPIQ